MSDIFWPHDDEPERRPFGGGSAGGSGETPSWAVTEPQPAATAPPPRRRVSTGIVALVAVTALVFGGLGVGVGSLLVGNNGNNSGSDSLAGTGFGNAATPTSDSHGSQQPHSVAAIAAKVLPSVVSITVVSPQQSDTGSGVVLRQDGYILTNNHVIAAASGGGGRITVTFNDGSTAHARIVGADAEDDLAVIKAAKSGLQPATLGTSSNLKVGDAVVAVGSPLGLQGTVTNGIVSALNRPVVASSSGQPQGFYSQGQTSQPVVYNAIQTDAPINPGNSGGPLVDAQGDVIGINSAIASVSGSSDPFGTGESGNIGVGFAIPVDQAKIIAGELMKNGKATHPLLGVTLADVYNRGGVDYARIQTVESGSPADKAGLKPGDVITKIDGRPTQGADAVIATIRSFQPGQSVSITYRNGLRGSAEKTVTVPLADASSAQG